MVVRWALEYVLPEPRQGREPGGERPVEDEFVAMPLMAQTAVVVDQQPEGDELRDRLAYGPRVYPEDLGDLRLCSADLLRPEIAPLAVFHVLCQVGEHLRCRRGCPPLLGLQQSVLVDEFT